MNDLWNAMTTMLAATTWNVDVDCDGRDANGAGDDSVGAREHGP